MMSEILIGRRGRRNPVTTMQIVGEEESGLGRWKYVGLMGVCGGIMILSYYSVVAGWALAYVPKAASGAFIGPRSAEVGAMFGGRVGDLEADAGLPYAVHGDDRFCRCTRCSARP